MTRSPIALLSALALIGSVLSAGAEPMTELRVGVTTYLSGAGAVFGVPAREAANLRFEEINRSGGIKGARLRPLYIDENLGVEAVSAEFKRLIQSGDIDVAIVGLSSSICLALAPLAEQLDMPTILWDCGTARIFEETAYKSVFRTADYTPQNNVAAALYLLKVNPGLKSIAGINPDYAFGRDNWTAFKEAILALKPDVKVVAELFPKLGSSDLSTEISRLSTLRADVVFSSLWGSDMNTFLKQASSRNLFRTTQLVSPNGESSMEQVGSAFPVNAIVGGRGDNWAFSPFQANDPQHGAFVNAIRARTGASPIFPSYQMAQAISALAKVLETGWDGQKSTLRSTVVSGLKDLTINDFTGNMTMRSDHQGVEGQLFGTTAPFVDGRPTMTRVTMIPGDVVTPPVGVKSADWIRSLKPSVLDGFAVPAK